MIDAPMAPAATRIGTVPTFEFPNAAMQPMKTRISPSLSKVESMNAPNLLALPVARASVPSNMSKTPPTKTTMPPMTHACAPVRIAPTVVIANPISVSPFGVRPIRPMASAIGSKIFLMAPRDSFEMVIGSARHAQDRALARCELTERFLPQAADRLAALAPRLDDAGGAEATEMP